MRQKLMALAILATGTTLLAADTPVQTPETLPPA